MFNPIIRTIARGEFVQMARDGRFRAAALFVLALLIASLGMGAKHHGKRQAERTRAASVQRAQWLAQGEKSPHAAAHYGVYAFKPAMPLSLVDRGVEEYVGVAVWLEAHKQNDFRFRPAQDATALQRFGELTAAFVLQYLLPLLIILLTFAAFAGERERGTLRQVMSLGVPPSALALGKALGVSLALCFLLAPAALVGSLALVLSGADGTLGAGEATTRAALIAAAYFLYFGITLAISLAVSARVSGARTALVGLLCWWIAVSLIAPRLAADSARREYPAPSALAFAGRMERELESGLDGRSSRDLRRKELEQSAMAKYGVKKIEDLPVSFQGLALQEGEDWGYTVFDRNYGGLNTLFGRQDSVHRTWGLVAPLLSVRGVSMGLAGTDREQHYHFARAAEMYRRSLIKIINDDVTYHSKTGDDGYTNGLPLWEKVPPFRYTPPSLAATLAEQRGDFGVLLLGFLAAAVVALCAVRTIKVL